jgi:hypothetical protein
MNAVTAVATSTNPEHHREPATRVSRPVPPRRWTAGRRAARREEPDDENCRGRHEDGKDHHEEPDQPEHQRQDAPIPSTTRPKKLACHRRVPHQSDDIESAPRLLDDREAAGLNSCFAVGDAVPVIQISKFPLKPEPCRSPSCSG